MTKAELIDAVFSSQNVPDDVSKKSVQAVIDATFEEIKTAIKDENRFLFPGFGTFSQKTRAARKGRNPKTGETIDIKSQKTVTFKPAQSLRDFLTLDSEE